MRRFKKFGFRKRRLQAFRKSKKRFYRSSKRVHVRNRVPRGGYSI